MAMVSDKLSVLWFLLGALLLPWITAQTVIPLAAWLAPILLIRFVRTQPVLTGIAAVTVANVVAQFIACRGGLVPVPPGPQLYAIVIGMGLMHSLYYLVDRLVATRLTGFLRTLVFPFAVVTVDVLMDRFSPYGMMGSAVYSQFDNLTLMQLISVTGIWGLSFIVAWGASSVNALWESKWDLGRSRYETLPFVVITLCALLFGGARLAFGPVVSPTVQVTALGPNRTLTDQAGFDRGNRSPTERERVQREAFDPLLDDLLVRTRKAAAGGARIVAWAEAAVYVMKETEEEVIQRASAVAREERIYLLVAIIPVLDSAEFPFVENRAVMFDPEGQVVWRYDKAKPVPGDGHLAGDGVVPYLETPFGRLASIICFDADFPRFVRQVGVDGVDLLFVPSSDWEVVAELHSRMSVFRAIENGVSLVRPTRQGTSLAVDPYGRLLGYNPDYFVSAAHSLTTHVPTKGTFTLYRTLGDSFAYASVVALLVFWVVAFRRRKLPA